MGLPAEDWPAIHAMAERNSGSQDPDVSDGQERGSASIEMAMYAMQFAADRRASGPQGDLTDVLLGEEFDGHLMTDIDFARFFVQLVTAGNDTTRTMLSSGTLALLDHPDQLAALRADPSGIPEPWRRSSVGRTRSTTSAARQWSIPNWEGRPSAPATRWR